MKTEIIENINTTLVKSYNDSINNGIDSHKALDESLAVMSKPFSELGVSTDIIDSLSLECFKIFEEALADGINETEALNLVINNIKQSMIDIKVSSENNADGSNYDFNFLDPSDSVNAQIINEGIAQGMTVEEAIKNANLKIFPEENVQGPPTLAELKEVNKEEEIVAEKIKPIDDENKELNIIEADMDAEELNNLSENADKTDIQQNTEQIIGSENVKENNEDDTS